MRRRNRGRDKLAEPEVLEGILERAGEARFSRVRPPFEATLWRDAVGARIADRAQPLALRDGVLVLRVTNSVWAHELSLLAESVCLRLRERGVEARTLRFRVGEPALAERRPEPRLSKTVPTVKALPSELARVLRDVDDTDLRGSIARAAAANLAWQTIAGAAPEQPFTPISEARRGARAPRSAESGNAPPDRTPPASHAGAPDIHGGGRGPRR
jgi:hypothetical protein